MIVSHRYRFIFIKTRKTAGTSIELALSSLLGPDDIITPVGPAPWDEAYRARMGFMTARNFQRRWHEIRLGDLPASARIACKKLTGRYSVKTVWPMAFWPHMSASDARHALGDDIWNSYFRFAVERNPWDFAVSLYHWKLRRNPQRRMSFAEYVQRGYPARYANSRLYTIDGEIAVDRLLHFETLDQELDETSTHLGFPRPLSALLASIKAKSGIRDDHGYRDRFSAPARDRISREFAREISTLGYTF